jgi:hypothetical protein
MLVDPFWMAHANVAGVPSDQAPFSWHGADAADRKAKEADHVTARATLAALIASDREA